MNSLIVSRKLSFLLVGVIALVATSLSIECGPAAEVQFGYNYDYVTPPQWTPDGRHVILSRYGTITVTAVDGSGSSWPIHGVHDRLNDRSVRYDDSHAPDVSPDGTEVAYMRRYTRDDVARDLNYEIHVASLDGSNIRRLTENDSHEASPVWSPDGRRIAYWSDSPEGSDWALMTMANDGTDKRYVTTVENIDPPPARWSPDGKQLAFVGLKITPANYERNTSWDFAVYVVGADGSNPTRLAPTSSSPLWSHDGSRLFYIHAQENADSEDIATALYSIRPDGTDLRTVANMEDPESPKSPVYEIPLWGNLDWSPDGSEIWYFSNSKSIRIKADGTDVSILEKRYSSGSTEAALSPNGSILAVQVAGPGSGFFEEEDKDVVFFLMDPDGTNPRDVFRRSPGGDLILGGGLPSENLTEWKLTRYAPLEEQSEETAIGSELTSAVCSETDETCQSRDVSQTVWPPRIGSGAGYDLEIETPTVEALLERGFHSVGLSPVHIAFRGTANAMSTRCAWRSTARTLSQREREIRFWLGLDESDSLPSPAQVEQRFNTYLARIGPSLHTTLKADLLALARGGESDHQVTLVCYVDYATQEYILGNGPAKVTIGYDMGATGLSYELYTEAHESGMFGEAQHIGEGVYQGNLANAAWAVETALADLVEGSESVVFASPMGAHFAISVEVWQAIAQWDLQFADDGTTVNAVRYGLGEEDSEFTQTLANLKTRVTTAAASDDFATTRVTNVSGLTQYYQDMGAYGDITPGRRLH